MIILNILPSNLARLTAGATLLPLALWGGVWAGQRQSASFAITIDSLNVGGGTSASTSYRQSDSAIGQESVCGCVEHGTLVNHVGYIQAWGGDHADARAWADYP